MTDAPERIWLQLGAGEYGTHTWCDQPQGWADENGEGEPEYIRADLHAAAIAELVEGLREMCAAHDRIMGDTHWRTNDNTLWPDACAAGKTARALIAKYGDKTDG